MIYQLMAVGAGGFLGAVFRSLSLLIFANKVDYMFIVAASRKTKKELLLNTKKAIESVGGKIPGIILNQISSDRRKEYSKSYQKYVIEK